MVSVPHLLCIVVDVSFPESKVKVTKQVFSVEKIHRWWLVVVQLQQVMVSPLCIEADLIITYMAGMKACEE